MISHSSGGPPTFPSAPSRKSLYLCPLPSLSMLETTGAHFVTFFLPYLHLYIHDLNTIAIFIFLFITLFFIILLLFYYSYSIFPLCPPLPIPHPALTPFPHHCPCPWVIHTCSLTSPISFFPPFPPPPSSLVTFSLIHVPLPWL